MEELTTWLEEPQNERLATKLMSHLASGLAHEMNNIFTVILGNISMLRIYLTKDPQKAAVKLDEAEKALLRARTLINRVHQISTKKPIIPENLAVLPIIRDELKQFNEDNIDLQIIPDGWQPQIKGSEELFRSAIHNGLANALEAAAPNTMIKVLVNNAELNSTNYCVISFSNFGTPIAPENIAANFIPYVSDKPKASGLGLTIIRSVMLQHLGKIELSSAENGETVLKLWFPL